MHKLKPITPLGGTEPKVDSFPGLTITENPTRALASLSARLGHESDCATKARDLIGVDLPGPGQTAAGQTYSAIWIGPDSWMIDADHASHEILAAELKAAVGDTASVVEQTDGWCRFDVSGPAVCDLFERLCNVDIRAMQAGTATRCSIHHIGCYLWCHEAGTAFSVLGLRSSAGSLHHGLVEIAQAVCTA